MYIVSVKFERPAVVIFYFMYSIKDIKEIWKSSLRIFAMKGSACYYILPNAVEKLRCSNP